MKIGVVLGDAAGMIREGLAALLEREPDLQVVAEAEDGETALRRIRELEPQVAVIDASLPRLSGVEVARRVREANLRTGVVLLAAHREAGFVREATEAGALGCVIKESGKIELLRAVRAAALGKSYVSPQLARELRDSGTGGKVRLAPRELDVLRLVVSGLTSRQIAGRLGFRPATVHWYRAAIMQKLGVRTVPGLVKYALSQGLAEID